MIQMVKEAQDKAAAALEAGRVIVLAWSKDHAGDLMPPDKEAEVDKHFDEAERWGKEATRREKANTTPEKDEPKRKAGRFGGGPDRKADGEDGEGKTKSAEHVAMVKYIKFGG